MEEATSYQEEFESSGTIFDARLGGKRPGEDVSKISSRMWYHPP
jgi:hypothetical protein